MWPVLVVMYYRLAKKEEKEAIEVFGERYEEYKRKTPMFFPFIRRRNIIMNGLIDFINQNYIEGIIDHARKYPCFMNARRPEMLSQKMILAHFPGYLS